MTLTQSGAHQVANACAAAALAIGAGRPLDEVVDALGTAQAASPWRMELHERADGVVVVNDAYNANPDSMEAALDTLVAIGRRRGARTVAVLGEMRELGDETRRATSASAASRRPPGPTSSSPWARSPRTSRTVPLRRGAGPVLAVRAAGRDEALTWLRQNVAAGDVVLVKRPRRRTRTRRRRTAGGDLP